MKHKQKELAEFKQYLDNKIFLTEEQEKDLYEQMKNGDDDARDDLIMGHKYLVIKLALKYAPHGSYEDLLQEGFIGLIKAVDKYDIEKGRLRTYADRRIRQHMLRYLDKTRNIIRLPEPQTYALLKLLRIRGSMRHDLGREPSLEEIMDNPQVVENHKQFQKSNKSKMTLKEYVSLLKYGASAISLNSPVSDDSENTLEDFIEDPNQQKEFNRIEKENLVNVVMDDLDEREIFVLKSIANDVVLQEIGNELGITAQAVSSIKFTAIRKIKASVRNNPELKEIINNMGFLV